ncbi:zinc finger CCHC domain-containing protein 14 isoform X1 [Entelurus aequoreus]|uniref:zinc finger CCHC domain-containing protein 14 isoform X1 n=1 Tax=Entelurus aequoreus TaxID=161455 RepID=UPI002B1D695F|nr:zinc finger CCHC domain-containing protein 14 isoform X1 [Entelurus aequoreus]
MVESRSHVQRDGVYLWFSSLTSAQRAEFLCGLLDLCVPIELRFLGSCLEDLARKDYHSLRDAEIKANNPTDLSGLTNITDEVVRSKLLVSLALLGSDNREGAGVLYQTLTHIDTVINNYGVALNDGRAEEQFLLLFTMASNHPAFSFHQKQVLRQQLSQIQDILQSQTREAGTASVLGSVVTSGKGDQAASQELSPPHLALSPPHLPPPSTPPAGPGLDATAPPQSLQGHQGKRGTVVIERVALRGVTHKFEDTSDYMFEASWSDGLVSSVVRSQQEVTELLSQLSQAFPNERVDKNLTHTVESEARCLTALPCHVLQHHSVQLFFTSTRPLSPNYLFSFPSSLPNIPSSPSTASVDATCPFTSSHTGLASCAMQYRGANRAVYRVASVQPVVSTHNSAMARSSTHVAALPLSHPPTQHSPQLSSLPPHMPALPTQGFLVGRVDASSQPHPQSKPCHSLQSHTYSDSQQSSLHQLHLQTSPHPSTQPQHSPHSQSLLYCHSRPRPQSHTQSLSQSQVNTPEQNGILDWLRKLRLHKYYPVFKQLTMEEFLALTEEDLNKYDLTQGAKKKLKTQLELQKFADREMKMEKRTCSSIARVTPSSHMGTSMHASSTAVELRVEVDTVLHHHPVRTDSSSSSGYSSSSCSPRTPLCCDSTVDRSRDMYRRVSLQEAVGGSHEKDRSCIFILNSHCPAGSSRPTAQVLPVQTDPAPPVAPSSSSHLPFTPSHYHPQGSYPQSLLSPASNPARILSSPRKPRPPPLCMEDRTKVLGSGLSGTSAGFSAGMRLENLLPKLKVDGSSVLHDPAGGLGPTGAAVGLMVETSCALTSTSNSLHHVSQPPLQFHLSSSSSSSPSLYYSYPSLSSSTASFSTYASSKPMSQPASCSGGSGFVSMATAGTVPIAAVPGNMYYPARSSPGLSASPGASLDPSPGHTHCVCSSCGCQGSCGAYSALSGCAPAAGYLQPFTAASVFTLGPLLHLRPLVASSSGTGATPFSYPMIAPHPLYCQSHVSHDQHKSFGFYHTHGIVGNGSQRRVAGNFSCYNCGANGHRAEDCKQPLMDSTQQSSFRLKYTPHSDSKDSGD